ncbi:MAG: DEAD/DEAH box helicase [Rudaea sp.]
MNPQQLHRQLQHCKWRNNFDARTLQRGLDYANGQRVLSLSFSAGNDVDECELAGEIRGSERQPYACSIQVRGEDRTLDVESHCTCPVEYECKHATAMLWVATQTPPEAWPSGATQATAALAPGDTHEAILRRLRQVPMLDRTVLPGNSPTLTDAQIENQAAPAWMKWLGQAETRGDVNTQCAEPQRQLGILLRAGEGDELLVAPVWLRPGKTAKSGFVDPQWLQLHVRRGAQPEPVGGWPQAVNAALALLLQEQSARLRGKLWTSLRAPFQEQALETLLEHYPAFFEKGSVPLQRGPNLALRLRWIDLDDGSQRLSAGIESDEAATLLRGSGLWYVLPKARRFGRVDGDLDVFDELSRAPAVLPEQVAALSEQLQTRKSALPIPLPTARGPIQLVEVAPLAVLRMRAIELSARNHHGRRVPTTLGCARLVFDYAGHRLAPTASAALPVRRMQAGRVLEIRRNREAEQYLEDGLEMLGLIDASLFDYEYGLYRFGIEANDFLLQPNLHNPHKPPLSPEGWKPLLEELAEIGFRIEYEASFPHAETLAIDDWHADIETSGNAWFDVSLGIDVGGQRVDLLPLLRRALDDPAFPRVAAQDESADAVYRVSIDENRSVQIPLQRLRALIEPLLEWLQGEGPLRLHRSQAPALRDLADAAQLVWRGGDALRAHLELLAHVSRSTRAPRGFKATLRPYQCEGLAWLDFLAAAGLGGILADDMGLGKTVQVLAHILGEKQRKRLDAPALVVAPTSLVGNWRDEAARFAPSLRVLVIHGADRADRYDEIAAHDLIITTYPLLPRDRDKLVEAHFSLLVLDEAQAIKNANSQAARVVREIPATRRLAMTGTPLENHLGELWAQFDAVEPGLLGSARQFAKLYRTPIEKHADVQCQQRLNRRIGPLLLRRRKDDVLTDLPAKTEIVRKLELQGDQRGLYETLRLAQHERVRQIVKQRGLAQAGIVVLDALLKLRQACCDPRLVKLPSAQKVKTSVKLDALLELLEGLLSEGRRILLFSQFTEMLGLIEVALVKRHIDYQVLTGQTPARNRTALVKRFQRGEVPLFLISLKAGGVGLNLTAADSVIHYDPWWNPAVEAQATDRAHRIGQDKPVFVYKLIAAGTVEEKIQAMQARKAELARAVLEGGATQRLRFDEADLAELFAPL